MLRDTLGSLNTQLASSLVNCSCDIHDSLHSCKELYGQAISISEDKKVIRTPQVSETRIVVKEGVEVCHAAFQLFLDTLIRVEELIEWRISRLGSHCVFLLVTPKPE